jgi:prevent-host-death family protein
LLDASPQMTMTTVISLSEHFMQTIEASEFKANCLALMDQVAKTGKALLVTKNGKPIAELRPHQPATGPVLGILKDQVKIVGDILAPLDPDALK